MIPVTIYNPIPSARSANITRPIGKTRSVNHPDAEASDIITSRRI